MILHGLIVLIIFWAIFSRTHRIKVDVAKMKTQNDKDHDILAREVLRHHEMILRQEEENRKQAEKVEKEISKLSKKVRQLEFKIAQAEDDIAFNKSQMKELCRYGEHLRKKLEACAYGSDEWHKWNNAITTNNAKVHAVMVRMNKAKDAKREAEIELEEVA